MLETSNLISSQIPQEKDGFLSRKVGYEIERRLVKAVQVRTLRKKKQKKGHYHYYPFYEKQNYKVINISDLDRICVFAIFTLSQIFPKSQVEFDAFCVICILCVSLV